MSISVPSRRQTRTAERRKGKVLLQDTQQRYTRIAATTTTQIRMKEKKEKKKKRQRVDENKRKTNESVR